MRPTRLQHVRLQACLDAHRELYNAALQERRGAWRMCQCGISYGAQSAQLKDIRAVRPDVAAWSFSSQQATLRRLNMAFGAFFRRVKAGETPGYPRFKAGHRFDNVEWPCDGDGCRWRPEASRVYLQGIGHVKVTVHRRVEGRLETISIKRQGRKWMLVLACDDVPARPLQASEAGVGVDVGINVFAATTDPDFAEGGVVANPRWARTGAGRLAAAQRALAWKKRGSANRRAARQTVAAHHRKIANQRADFHHKLAGYRDHADTNAARNILRAGLAPPTAHAA
jgi:putative transposase